MACGMCSAMICASASCQQRRMMRTQILLPTAALVRRGTLTFVCAQPQVACRVQAKVPLVADSSLCASTVAACRPEAALC